MLPWHQYIFGLLFVLAGVNHFRRPKMYEKIVPPYIPSRSTVVILSGVAEMVLGFMLLNKNTQVEAAWGIIVLLLFFIPVHIYMIQEKSFEKKIPFWILVLRLPLQLALILWAALYTGTIS